MIGLVMAGGKGTRMDISNEKLLLEYKKPVIFHVIDALKNSHCFSQVIVATSPNSPDTKHVLEQNRIETLSTPGNGYVNDLNFLLQKMSGSVFVTSGDLPLLDEKIIQVITEKFNSENVWTSFLVSKKFLNSLGLESSLLVNSDNIECTYTGISIINVNKIKNLNSVKENYIILDDKRIAFNLNTRKDYELLNSS
ncbi:NTP transferase domain-containing protein [Marine Group I thaumarchaeote]|uniref:NTP transferase domain-containing protein n=1 Tax=Marine Group I thaumarchaeote TaxID=2511932 RepID=A0A7K4N1P0_9ARCH|nr:NTP transferase domain-containing protein [Marine Group I thaumarchaeote]